MPLGLQGCLLSSGKSTVGNHPAEDDKGLGCGQGVVRGLTVGKKGQFSQATEEILQDELRQPEDKSVPSCAPSPPGSATVSFQEPFRAPWSKKKAVPSVSSKEGICSLPSGLVYR